MVRAAAVIAAVLLAGCQQAKPTYDEQYRFLQRMLAPKAERCDLIRAAMHDATTRLDGGEYSLWHGRFMAVCGKGPIPNAGEAS